jgi:endonuclease/exonuclease/phosphatase family metal-dependent hydrolase
MSFNLRVCRFTDFHRSWPFRRESAGEAVKAQKPWLLGTQEGTARMLQDLDRMLPDYDRVGTGRLRGGMGEHNAIYYHKKKLAVLEWGQFWLSETPEEPGSIGWDARFPRICTWARMRVLQEPAAVVSVYNTHLDHVGQEAGSLSTLLIWQMIQDHQKQFGVHPVLLTGDFNAKPDHPVIRFFSGEGELAGMRTSLSNAFADPRYAGSTYHGFMGGKKGQPIDFLFGGFGLLPMHGDVIRSQYNGRYPSDHYPVTAVFKLKLSKPQTRRIL